MSKMNVTADNLDGFMMDLSAYAPHGTGHVAYGVACHSKGFAEFWGWDDASLSEAKIRALRLAAKHGVPFTAVEMIVTARLIHHPA